MKKTVGLLLKISVFLVAAAVMVLLFILPGSWWQPLLFCFTFAIIGGYLLLGGVVGTAMLIFGTVMYVFLFIKAFSGELPMPPVVAGIAIMYACYFIVKTIGDTSSYMLSSANDDLKSLEADYNALIIEKKNISISVETNKMKLEKFEKLRSIYESLKTFQDFSSKIRQLLKNVVELFHQDKSIALFLVKQDKIMKVMADRKEDMLTGERDIDSLYLKNFDEFILKNKKSIIITDMARDIRFKAEDAENINALISVPVFCNDQIAGILRVTSDKAGVFNQEDLRFLDIIGSMVGKVLEEEHYA